MLGNKILCGGKTHFSGFVYVLNKEMSNAVVDHSRSHNTRVFKAKWVFIRHLREDAMNEVPTGTPVPCQSWLEMQFVTNETRSMKIMHIVEELI